MNSPNSLLFKCCFLLWHENSNHKENEVPQIFTTVIKTMLLRQSHSEQFLLISRGEGSFASLGKGMRSTLL
jgi:hypothetical protein